MCGPWEGASNRQLCKWNIDGTNASRVSATSASAGSSSTVANAAQRQASAARGNLTWIRLGAADDRLVTPAHHAASRIVA